MTRPETLTKPRLVPPQGRTTNQDDSDVTLQLSKVFKPKYEFLNWSFSSTLPNALHSSTAGTSRALRHCVDFILPAATAGPLVTCSASPCGRWCDLEKRMPCANNTASQWASQGYNITLGQAAHTYLWQRRNKTKVRARD